MLFCPLQQDNEPITLDDTDDEEAGPGPGSMADAALLRRSQRSNAFKGPSQRFQVNIQHTPTATSPCSFKPASEACAQPHTCTALASHCCVGL